MLCGETARRDTGNSVLESELRLRGLRGRSYVIATYCLTGGTYVGLVGRSGRCTLWWNWSPGWRGVRGTLRAHRPRGASASIEAPVLCKKVPNPNFGSCLAISPAEPPRPAIQPYVIRTRARQTQRAGLTLNTPLTVITSISNGD